MLTTIKIEVTTRSRLRRVAARTEEKHTEVLERLLSAEEARLASTPFTPEQAFVAPIREYVFMPVSAVPVAALDRARVMLGIAHDALADNAGLRPMKGDMLRFGQEAVALVEAVHSSVSYTILAPKGMRNTALAEIVRQHAAANTPAIVIKATRSI